jgi:hypothetical protein
LELTFSSTGTLRKCLATLSIAADATIAATQIIEIHKATLVPELSPSRQRSPASTADPVSTASQLSLQTGFRTTCWIDIAFS